MDINYFSKKLSLGALLGLFICFIPSISFAASAEGGVLNLNMTNSVIGFMALGTFAIAYVVVMMEEFLHLRKSKPVVLAAGLIWIMVATTAASKGLSVETEAAVRHNLLEYCELFLFLLVAMTYVNAIEERQVFEALRAWLVKKRFTYRKLFWITGIISFFMSPVADNLTTALIMCAVVVAVGADRPKFITISCINIVVAANAGGAFSPFGDITTLMVWQKGILPFQAFFQIFLPSLVSYLIPAAIMHFAVPNETPKPVEDNAYIHKGGLMCVILFLLTIATAVSFHNFLHLPPTVGMMTGLAYLQFYGYYLKKRGHTLSHPEALGEIVPFDIFRKIQRAEWDTLLFFYGVVVCVGGLSAFGYLSLASDVMYHEWGQSLAAIHQQTPANVAVGVLSAIIDNIPVMFAVLTMNPAMSEGQWLLVTLTAGIGGSMLSIGSAAGVALMGQSKGHYTFFGHLKWIWAIALGYVAGIAVHIWWNAHLFTS